MKWSVVTVAALLAGCVPQMQSSDRPATFNPTGPYVHQATGFIFPVAPGAFIRSDITEYNSEKTNISAGYNKDAGDKSLAVTIYVKPAPPVISLGSPPKVVAEAKDHLCRQLWEAMKETIIRVHPGAELISDGEVASPSVVFKGRGLRAIYRYTETFDGVVQPLRSEADLFCYAGQGWMVSYRATAPAGFDYHADLDTLMRDLQWPDSLGG
ncbi:hypothetical protein [Radicibacter daui]|uniref:hypothetical protein n=1 Tax=Radicibacter daui TaxID=3064829 RepID=UPI004046C77D